MSAARMDDLLPGLRQHQPAILHFAGHGEGYGELQFSDDEGKHAQGLWVEAFASLIKAYQDEAETPLRLAVLAGCHTAPAAHHLAAHVDCAIGFDTSIADDAIINFFTPTLYGAMFDGRSVGNAVDSARSVLEAHDQGYVAQAMQVYVRKGVDASTLKPVAWAQTGGRPCRPASPLPAAPVRGEMGQRGHEPVRPGAGQTGRSARHLHAAAPGFHPVAAAERSEAEVEDWWCGREALPGEEELAEVDTRRPRLCSRRRGSADAPEEAMRLQKQRNWASLLVDEAGLRPLLAQAEAWAGAQPAPGEGKAPHRGMDSGRPPCGTDPARPSCSSAIRAAARAPSCGTWRCAGRASCAAALATAACRPPLTLAALPGWTRACLPIYCELHTLVGQVLSPAAAHEREHAADCPGLAEFRAYLAHATAGSRATGAGGMSCSMRCTLDGPPSCWMGWTRSARRPTPAGGPKCQAFMVDLVKDFAWRADHRHRPALCLPTGRMGAGGLRPRRAGAAARTRQAELAGACWAPAQRGADPDLRRRAGSHSRRPAQQSAAADAAGRAVVRPPFPGGRSTCPARGGAVSAGR